LPTGDLGRLDDEGNLLFLGRKKDVIVTADGLNVYPEDVEAKLTGQPAIQEAAVAPREVAGRPLVHAVIVPVPGASAEQIERAISETNRGLEAHQRIRSHSVWPEPALPRTVSTQKVQRAAIAAWVNGQQSPSAGRAASLTETLQRITGRTDLPPGARLEDLGLTSLDRAELITHLESGGLSVSPAALGDLAPLMGAEPASVEPEWPRRWPAAALRGVTRTLLMFPLLRRHVRVRAEGLDKLATITAPVLFVANHQSILDVPVILRALPAAWRRRIAPAMGPGNFGTRRRLFLARCFLNGYLLAPGAAAVQSALRHAGRLADAGYCTLLFPEGERTPDGTVHPFRPGVGIMAERLRLPVVPLVLEGLYEIWPVHQARPGRGSALVRILDPLRVKPGESAAEFTRRLESLYRR
jgi:long-chain acyl-CoA synthetase